MTDCSAVLRLESQMEIGFVAGREPLWNVSRNLPLDPASIDRWSSNAKAYKCNLMQLEPTCSMTRAHHDINRATVDRAPIESRRADTNVGRFRK